MNEGETIRWPTSLNHHEIHARLAQVREAAESAGLTDLAGSLAGLAAMPPAKVASAVVSALSWLEGKPEHEAITRQLEMIALNLKNLR